MFALLALLCFVLAMFVTLGLNLIALGLAFLAAHFLFGTVIAMPWRARP